MTSSGGEMLAVSHCLVFHLMAVVGAGQYSPL